MIFRSQKKDLPSLESILDSALLQLREVTNKSLINIIISRCICQFTVLVGEGGFDASSGLCRAVAVKPQNFPTHTLSSHEIRAAVVDK
jgi:hypothetical protein